ncbi:MAG: hypothetical protein PHX25_04070 [Candidatus Pacebacteria bacterium]|nr:hypothetical protein [Candidatus Paceibacterota bacterium]
MYLKVLYLSESFKELEIDQLILRLKSGVKYRFAYHIEVNLEKETICLILAVTENSMDHNGLFCKIHEYSKRGRLNFTSFLLDIPPNILGAGYLEIQNDDLIIFDSSSKFGKYKEQLLSPAKEHFLSTFKVNNVIFQ